MATDNTDWVDENPLLQLPKEQQKQLADVVQNGDIDAIADETGLTRRQVIMAGVGLAVGTAAGGITAQELIEEAQAAASTSDKDGNIGLPGNRVDVFSEGIDNDGEIVTGSLNTDALNITEEINYWPPARTDFVLEINDESPPTSYASLSLSGPPDDAVATILTISSKGDGSPDYHEVGVREMGSGRDFDGRARGWAGHEVMDAVSIVSVPLSSDNEIEYEATNSAVVDIQTIGYY